MKRKAFTRFTVLLFVLFVFIVKIFPVKAKVTHQPGKLTYKTAIFTEYFNWKEYNTDGSKDLEEEGWRDGIRLSLERYWENHFFTRGTAKFYFGRVDYDGHTQSGTPVSTDGNYQGYYFELNGGYEWAISKRMAISPFAGIAYENWYRDLESTSAAIGYTENWKTLFWKVGTDFSYEITDNGFLTAQLWGGKPFYTKNRADIATVDVEPKGDLYVGGSIGYEIRGDNYDTNISLYSEYRHWDKSDPEIGYFNGQLSSITQPESKEFIAGLLISIGF